MVQALEQSPDRAALPRRTGNGAEQRGANVLVAEATSNVVAIQDGGEQTDGVAAGGKARPGAVQMGERT